MWVFWRLDLKLCQNGCVLHLALLCSIFDIPECQNCTCEKGVEIFNIPGSAITWQISADNWWNLSLSHTHTILWNTKLFPEIKKWARSECIPSVSQNTNPNLSRELILCGCVTTSVGSAAISTTQITAHLLQRSAGFCPPTGQPRPLTHCNETVC